jgi:predicted O-linked N-acetylglucosamine transferase (SPINDLY family)
LRDALAAFKAGNLAEADRLCDLALAASPEGFDALHLQGLVKARRGDLAAAERLLARAVAADPRSAAAQLNHGNALSALNRPGDALAAYARALALKPGYAPALVNRGAALLALGQAEEAAAAYREAVRAAPREAAAEAGLGNALKDLGRFGDAAAAYRRAVELRPDHAEALNNLGNTLKDLGRPDEAADALERAVELRPRDPAVADNLAAALYAQGRTAEAAAAHRAALALKADAAGASREARALCEALLELIGLPAIYRDEAEIEAARGRFAAGLERALGLAAAAEGSTEGEYALVVECLFKLNHFLLAYQQRNDRAPMQQWAKLAGALLERRIAHLMQPIAGRARGGKIRLGLASERLFNHNGVNWAYLWLAGLPAADYEFFFYALGGRPDWLTEKFAALGALRRLPFGPATFAESLNAIRADELDVLIYPDVGMTASSRVAAAARLAPIQCAGWGHPVTTGSPAIDYYLSSAAMEPADGDGHYSETLVRLPDQAVFFAGPAPDARPAPRSAFGLPEGGFLFGSAQNLLKYLPRDDDLYARVAAEVPQATLVFVASGAAHVNAVFAGRMRAAFARRGLDFDARAKILPRLPHAAFADLFGALDAALDTPGWNGANTTVLALARGCPMVTLPGEFMRGRHGLGLLGKAGLDELVAATPGDYVALAAKLARDPAWRSALKDRIARGMGRLLDLSATCRALDAFLKEKVAALGGPGRG